MTERWKPVVGFEGQYEVSDMGRVRSLDRIIMLERKAGLRPWRYRGKLLNPTPASHGYPTVRFPTGGLCVHILVLEAFVGPCPEGQECRHLDGDRMNPELSNLCWGTPTENRADAIRHGTWNHGSKVPQAKLNDQKVRYIRASDQSDIALAQELSVSTETIRRARIGEHWKSVVSAESQP